MRILHTSDWHLGRCLGQHRLLDDQAGVVDWLVEVVRDQGIDLVVVAGDLYDRSVPPAEAVELLADALGRFRAAGSEVVAIAGNHDSAERVCAYDALTDAAGVLIRGGYRRASQVAIRQYHDGPLAIIAVPYLDPFLAPADLRGGGRCTHESVLTAALDRARTDARVRAGRSLVVSHAFVTGAAPTTSERELAVGSAGMVSARAFDGFSYVALGHLHQPQAVGASGTIRYSGSPLPYSFSETGPKEVVVVDLDRSGRATTRSLPIPVGRPVATVRCSFAELLARPDDDPLRRAWLRVELTDVVPVVDAHRRLRDRFPHLVEIERVARVAGARALTQAEVRRSAPADLARSFWHDVTGQAPSTEVAQLLAGALAEAEREDDAA
jgi:DNA repair protein SbcD/Mre11